MWHINNLHGEIMLTDDRLCKFDVTNGIVSFSDVDESLPVPWELKDGITKSSIMDFLLERVTDENRQGLVESCAAAGIECSAEGLINYNHGLMLDDEYWIRTKTGPRTFKELQRLMGFEVSD